MKFEILLRDNKFLLVKKDEDYLIVDIDYKKLYPFGNFNSEEQMVRIFKKIVEDVDYTLGADIFEYKKFEDDIFNNDLERILSDHN